MTNDHKAVWEIEGYEGNFSIISKNDPTSYNLICENIFYHADAIKIALSPKILFCIETIKKRLDGEILWALEVAQEYVGQHGTIHEITRIQGALDTVKNFDFSILSPLNEPTDKPYPTRNVPIKNREQKSGQYTYRGDLERLCKCGHTLGNHCAERIKENGASIQDCMVSTFEPFTSCQCQCFEPQKKKINRGTNA